MQRIVTIVEGDGDVQAVPILLSRLLNHYGWSVNWYVSRPIRVGNLGNLKKNLNRFLELATLEKDCSAIMILLDLDEGCPKEQSFALADAIRELQLLYPVAIVMAHREYEAWFLASMQTIAGHCDIPQDVRFDGEVERVRGAKEWLTANMTQSPRPRRYKETLHQAEMTTLIDVDLAAQTSRSFRRLVHALEELTATLDSVQVGLVTPLKSGVE